MDHNNTKRPNVDIYDAAIKRKKEKRGPVLLRDSFRGAEALADYMSNPGESRRMKVDASENRELRRFAKKLIILAIGAAVLITIISVATLPEANERLHNLINSYEQSVKDPEEQAEEAKEEYKKEHPELYMSIDENLDSGSMNKGGK
jgi:hypothetical protein